MDKRAKDLCGAGLKRVCELADIPPVLHMGSCVDISRMMILAAELAKDRYCQYFSASGCRMCTGVDV